MILVDFSATFYAAVHVELAKTKETNVNENNLRHIMLNQLSSYNTKFQEEYGDMVICLEGYNGNWRRDFFPNYKYSRKKSREISGIDWSSIFNTVNKITEEFISYMPYKFIRVDKLEADDVIAILSLNAPEITNKNIMGDMEYPVLIVSNDKDYKQLQKHSYIKQYSPMKHTFIHEENPTFELLELILHGDTSDGIPNIKSNINCFVDGIKQKPVTSKFVREIKEKGLTILTEDEKKRFKENSRLIAFDFIPKEYHTIVIEKYKEKKEYNAFKLMQYLLSKNEREFAMDVDKFFGKMYNK